MLATYTSWKLQIYCLECSDRDKILFRASCLMFTSFRVMQIVVCSVGSSSPRTEITRCTNVCGIA